MRSDVNFESGIVVVNFVAIWIIARKLFYFPVYFFLGRLCLIVVNLERTNAVVGQTSFLF